MEGWGGGHNIPNIQDNKVRNVARSLKVNCGWLALCILLPHRVCQIKTNCYSLHMHGQDPVFFVQWSFTGCPVIPGSHCGL